MLLRVTQKSLFAKAIQQAAYSHGPTIGQVYAGYRKIDELLARVRPDSKTDPAQIDELLAKGEITPTMAAHFKKDITMQNEAKSSLYPALVILYSQNPPSIGSASSGTSACP